MENVGLKTRIAITPLIFFIILSHMLLESWLQCMEMLLQNVSLVSSVDVLICFSDENFLADPDADLMTLRHKEKIDGLNHKKEQLSKINGLKLQDLIVFFSGVESLDMVEALSALL